MSRLLTLLMIAPLLLALGVRDGAEVTPEQLAAVHTAYQKASSDGFSIESMVELYKLENAAPAVKKLVDAAQSNPAQSIPAPHSAAMEATRERMNMMMLEHLAEVTGGAIEVINFGKQNGIRSDKDQTVFATDGKRTYTASELKQAYGDHFQETFGLDMERMDMALFDGDASIPDWRRADMSYEEFVARMEKGQAMLEQNPEAYTEAGSYRAQVDRRTAEQGRVTLVRKNRETGEIEVVNGSASEVSSRYSDWTADVPYRNAMDASVENKARFEHTNDFIDKMKYFNRTIGDGVNALAAENWDVNYIFHFAELTSEKQKGAFIDHLVRDVYVIDVSAEELELFKSVIRTSAEIEVDKMKGETKAPSHYLERMIGIVEQRARAAGEDIGPAESLKRAQDLFYTQQKRVMDVNIVVTTRQKMLRDLAPDNLRRVARKYGVEQAKKLRYETARQIRRAFERIDDPKLLDRLVSEAPEEIRAEIESLRDVARARRKSKKDAKRRGIKLAPSDGVEARTQGPDEKTLDRVDDESFMEARRREVDELLDAAKARYEEFDAELRTGMYSDEFVTERLRNGVLESLGYEERAVLREMEVEYERQFSGSKLFSNVVNLGNVGSVLAMMEVYQQTGDMTMVARTALWELVSNFPGVSQFATLKQAFNDGDFQSLSWLFIAWKIPGAGQVKMIFDVTKQAMTIVYNHAMIPLENDRFSQVYMGYVDAQPAGWSPLVPGWKERREAVSDSILLRVPGETFEQKRTNMYAFFQARLHEKLSRSGLDPTTDEYWERRDQVVPSFFGAYVQDYFAARNDFYENTTVGHRAVGRIPDLKKRLIARLVADFKQGELNDRLSELAREEMMAAIGRIEDQQRENVALEKRVIAVEEHATDRLQAAIDARFDDLERVEDVEDADRVAVQAYPTTVLEGQQVTFAVKAVSADDGQGGEPHSIEVRRVSARPLVKGSTEVRKKLAEAVGESDAVFVKPLLDRPASSDAELYVTRVDYEVVVKAPDGRIAGKKTVSVNVAGLVTEEPETSKAVTVKVRIREEERGPDHFGARVIIRWEDPSPENLTPRAYTGRVPHLWIRWDDMPEKKRYAVRMRLEGGIPRFEKEWFAKVNGLKRFVTTERHKGPGRCFVVSTRVPRSTGGKVKLSGELLAFERRTRTTAMESGAATPVARFPFATAITFHPPRHEVRARAQVSNTGFLNGSVTVGYAQDGERPGRVDVGGRSVWGNFHSGMSFSIPDMTGVPSSLTIHFRDYGRDVSLEVPIENEGVKPRYRPDQRGKERLLEDLARLEKPGDDRFAAAIANTHGQLAKLYTGGGGWLDREAWLAETRNELAWMDRTHAAMGSIEWRGWSHGTSGLPMRGRYVNRAEPAKAARNARAIRADYRLHQVHAWREAADKAITMGDLTLAREFLEKAEAFARELDGENLAVAAGNLHLTRASFARRHYEASGDLDGALALHRLAEDWKRTQCRVRGVAFEPHEFHYDVGHDFDRGDG